MRVRLLIVVGCLIAASIAVARADRNAEPPPRAPFSQFPMDLGDWHGVQLPPFDDKILAVLGLDDYVTRNYRRDRTDANLYIGYWKSQRQGDTMHSPQNCLPGSGWEPVSQSLVSFPDPRDAAAPPVTVRRFIIQKGIEKQLVLYWYQSRGRVVASEYWSKFYLVLDAARYNRTDAALVRIVIPIRANVPNAEASADEAAVQFAGDLLPALVNYLPN
ncbi:MAG TPA: EpsI family protein [Vicinamibacterales bacterium]|nr:EpsI family protein [Vicinamibacterales bacterium]